MDDAFSYLDTIVRVSIDRPVGSRHPDWGYAYPINYGFVPGTKSGDGEPIDVYVLRAADPMVAFEGRCVAVIVREEEDDPKLVVVPDGENPPNEEIRAAVDFQERFFSSRIERLRAV